MNLFRDEKFISASGQELPFKIDCDALSDEDLDCMAKYAAQSIVSYTSVISVPTGGDRLAAAFEKYKKVSFDFPTILIVDDVWTTGKSMLNMISKYDLFKSSIRGIVLFSRGDHPAWVYSIFKLHSNLCNIRGDIR